MALLHLLLIGIIAVLFYSLSCIQLIEINGEPFQSALAALQQRCAQPFIKSIRNPFQRQI